MTGSVRKNCLWISRDKYEKPNLTKSRCNIKGVDESSSTSVADYCPLTCKCCMDSDDRFIIMMNSGGFISKQCEWVSRIKDSQRGLWKSRCSMPEVSQYCPYSCDTCSTTTSMSPSPTLSAVPTMGPVLSTPSLPFTASPSHSSHSKNPSKQCSDTDSSIRFLVPNPLETNGGTHTQKTCQWVQRLKNEQPNLVWNRCGISGVDENAGLTVADYCPKSCDTCGPCQNNRERFIIGSPHETEGSIRKTCNWVTRVKIDKPKVWSERCSIDVVKQNCAAACDICSN